VAAEFGHPAAATLLLDRGADVNARATVNEVGVGGQTAIFHAVTQFDDGGLPVTQLLLDRGADLAVRVKLPGDYERPGEIVECTPLGYALRFGGPPHRRTVAAGANAELSRGHAHRGLHTVVATPDAGGPLRARTPGSPAARD
jgi:ankyrin repeat protein